MITLPGVDPMMIANNLEPYYNTHPGEILKDEIEYRGISQRKLAAEIGVAPSQLNEVLNGKRALNTELAMLICAALQLDAEPLLRMQMDYDILEAKRNPTLMQRIARIGDWANSVRKVAAVL